MVTLDPRKVLPQEAKSYNEEHAGVRRVREKGDDVKDHLRERFVRIAVIAVLLVLVLSYASAAVLVQTMFSHRVERNAHTLDEMGLPGTVVALRSADGTPLSGFWIPTQTPRGVVLLLHGMDGIDASSLLPQAALLWKAGYSVFDLDMRAHGWSGGERIGLAFEEPLDASAALDWIASRGQPASGRVPVSILGISMGGATAIRTAAMRDDVDGVISVSSFASVDRMLGQGMRLMGAPAWMTAAYRPFIGLGIATVYRVWPATASPLHDIGDIAPRPVLIMHGTEDSQVPVENAQLLKSAGGGTVVLDIVEGADHMVFVGDGSGPEDEPYRKAILTFLSGIH